MLKSDMFWSGICKIKKSSRFWNVAEEDSAGGPKLTRRKSWRGWFGQRLLCRMERTVKECKHAKAWGAENGTHNEAMAPKVKSGGSAEKTPVSIFLHLLSDPWFPFSKAAFANLPCKPFPCVDASLTHAPSEAKKANP